MNNGPNNYFFEKYASDGQDMFSGYDVRLEYGKVVTFFSFILVNLVIGGMLMIAMIAHIEIYQRAAIAVLASGIYIYVMRRMLRNGRFILAANKDGICYRSETDKNKYICLPWKCVRSVDKCHKVRDKVRSVDRKFWFVGDTCDPIEIYTNIPFNGTLPDTPANGALFIYENTLVYNFDVPDRLDPFSPYWIELAELHAGATVDEKT